MIYSDTPKVNNSNEVDFEKITNAIPLIYGFLVFCGAIHLFVYYNYFEIDILQYLNISELLVSFLDIIIPILIMLIIIFIYVLGFQYLNDFNDIIIFYK